MAKPLLWLAAKAARWLPGPLKRGLYRLGPVSSGLRTALNRVVPGGLTEVEIAGGDLAGARMRLDLQSEKDYWLGTYEADLQRAIQDWVRAGMTVYDLGANVGYVSMLLGRAVGAEGKVLAFEPLPANLERLLANIDLNLDAPVRVVSKAAADKSGELVFQVHASDDMGKLEGSAGRSGEYSESIPVEAVALDDFVYRQGGPPPDLVKIDIEGGEGLALAGMAHLLKEERPLLFIEVHGQEAAKAVWAALTDNNYRLHHMKRGYPEIRKIEDLGWKSYVVGRPAS